jgi:hypothetical protein
MPLVAPVAGAEDLRFSSGSGQTVLIELFTSEGCNSCPPAEAYLNQITGSPLLWKKFIPVAFHVDYWDYLGWKDRYAHPAHTQRQHQYAQQRSVRSVYTPAFIVNGQGWRPSLSSGDPGGGGTPAGVLTVDLKGNQLEVTFKPENAVSKTLQLNLAVLGMGLSTRIQNGENAGRQSPHEFVMLALKQMSSDSGRWRAVVPATEQDRTAQRLALVAWVNQPGDLTPLQATGGYLPESATRVGKERQASPEQVRNCHVDRREKSDNAMMTPDFHAGRFLAALDMTTYSELP